MEHVIELEDITAAYDRQPVLWDLDLNIPKGSLMGIVGPNDAGNHFLRDQTVALRGSAAPADMAIPSHEDDIFHCGGKSRMSRRTVQSTGIFPPQ